MIWTNLLRLYEERIAALNSELAQVTGPNPTHPELLRQVHCIQQYRDEKFDIEQKLLVFKIGALKRKSVAERSQILTVLVKGLAFFHHGVIGRIGGTIGQGVDRGGSPVVGLFRFTRRDNSTLHPCCAVQQKEHR